MQKLRSASANYQKASEIKKRNKKLLDLNYIHIRDDIFKRINDAADTGDFHLQLQAGDYQDLWTNYQTLFEEQLTQVFGLIADLLERSNGDGSTYKCDHCGFSSLEVWWDLKNPAPWEKIKPTKKVIHMTLMDEDEDEREETW